MTEQVTNLENQIIQEKPAEKQEEQPEKSNVEPVEPTFITFEDFIKVELRVGQILAAERVEKSDKLLKLQVSLGETLGTRQILAGIGKHYEPQDIVGRKVSVVTNLQPRKMMGMLSEGMLLAASDAAGNLELVNPGNAITAGSRIG